MADETDQRTWPELQKTAMKRLAELIWANDEEVSIKAVQMTLDRTMGKVIDRAENVTHKTIDDQRPKVSKALLYKIAQMEPDEDQQ